MKDLCIHNATIIPMTDREKVIRNGSIHIHEGKIVDVGSGKREYKEAILMDAGGMILIPGLINAHVHLFQTLVRGRYDNLSLLDWLKNIYDLGKVLTPEDCYRGARLGCLEAIKSGTTTLVDHHFLFRDGEIADAIITAFKETKIRGFLVRGMMDTGELVAEEVRQSHRDIFGHCDDLITRYSKEIGEKKIGLMVGPNTPGINCTPQLIKMAKDFARDKNLRISTHIAENDGVLKAVRKNYGYGGVVEFLHGLDFLGQEVLGAHCVRVNPLEVLILKETGTKVVHNPVSNMFLGDGVAPVAHMLSKGVCVSLGSDSTAANNSQDMFEVMKTTTLLQRVANLDASLLPPWDTLELATLGGARALGLEEEVGTLEVGKRADLIGIDFSRSAHAVAMHSEVSQIVHCARPSDVSLVVIDGEIVLEDGRLKAMEEEVILREAQLAAESLVGRMAS